MIRPGDTEGVVKTDRDKALFKFMFNRGHENRAIHNCKVEFEVLPPPKGERFAKKGAP